MNAPDPDLPDTVLSALAQGQVIEAIKCLREARGLGLKEAKDVIDRHQAGLPAVRPSTADGDQELPDFVVAALQQGNAIEAIKRLRAASGPGLKEAKDAVDEYMRRHSASRPQQATVSRGGTAQWPWLFVLALVAAAFWAFLSGEG